MTAFHCFLSFTHWELLMLSLTSLDIGVNMKSRLRRQEKLCWKDRSASTCGATDEENTQRGKTFCLLSHKNTSYEFVLLYLCLDHHFNPYKSECRLPRCVFARSDAIVHIQATTKSSTSVLNTHRDSFILQYSPNDGHITTPEQRRVGDTAEVARQAMLLLAIS